METYIDDQNSVDERILLTRNGECENVEKSYMVMYCDNNSKIVKLLTLEENVLPFKILPLVLIRSHFGNTGNDEAFSRDQEISECNLSCFELQNYAGLSNSALLR